MRCLIYDGVLAPPAPTAAPKSKRYGCSEFLLYNISDGLDLESETDIIGKFGGTAGNARSQCTSIGVLFTWPEQKKR